MTTQLTPVRYRAVIEFDVYPESLQKKKTNPRSASWLKSLDTDPTHWDTNTFGNMQLMHEVDLQSISGIEPVE